MSRLLRAGPGIALLAILGALVAKAQERPAQSVSVETGTTWTVTPRTPYAVGTDARGRLVVLRDVTPPPPAGRR